MKKQIIEAETAKLAGLLIDLLAKIRSGTITLRRFEVFLNQKSTVVFPILMKIKVGTHKSTDELRQSFGARDRISVWAAAILDKIVVAKSEMEITLHVATVRELTGANVANYEEICQAIDANGYELCPAEAGPQLRLQNHSQPEGERYFLAMHTVEDETAKVGTFLFENDGHEYWLRAGQAYPKTNFLGDNRFVFMSCI